MTDESAKELLGKAFGSEPPLRLDRAEILRRGRRQVRVRRFAASGGVAAAVVAVVLGAAALTNLTGDGTDDSLAQPTSAQPTSSPATIAPPGPQLPLTTTTSPLADPRAAELTGVLADARLIPNGFQLFSQSDGTTPLAFTRQNETYRASANLQDPSGGGDVLVALSRADPTAPPASCASLGGKSLSCSVVTEAGLPMVVATQLSDDGVLSNVVRAVRPDGTEVLVIAGNAIRVKTGIIISGAKPPLDVEVLKKIAALPRLRFA